MMTKPAKRVRCAVYPRVSTEYGLDQEFNSLDAQYEGVGHVWTAPAVQNKWNALRAKVAAV